MRTVLKMLQSQIMNFLRKMEDDSQINTFWDFLIYLRNQQHVSKQKMYEILMQITQEDMQDGSLSYNIVTDTLDYFVGWHSPLKPEHPAYDFVKQLNA